MWIEYILKYYSLFGLHFIPNARFGGKSTSFFIYSFQMGLCFWCSIWAFKAFIVEQKVLSFLDAINFFLYYLTSALTYWAILYDSYTKKDILCGFWQNFIKISSSFSTQFDLNKWNFLIAFIILLLIDIIMSGLAFYRSCINSEDYVAHYHFLVIYDQRILFYLLHMKIVIFQLQKIENELKCIQQHKVYLSVNFVSLTENQFKWIRHNYSMIREMVDNMNHAFGISNLAITLHSFHSAIAFSNFIYRQIHHSFYTFNSSWSFEYLQSLLKNKINLHFVGLLMYSSFALMSRIAFHTFYFNKFANECYNLVIYFSEIIRN